MSETQATSAAAPFFSIGVTTYDRVALLVETLASILGQTFTDLEIIVGNDNPARMLAEESLGIHDPRLRFVNNQHNLGELENMNSLLALSRGRYFTWIADDDQLDAAFFQAVHQALIKFDYPPCVYTSYVIGSTLAATEKSAAEEHLYTGRKFLNLYLTESLKAIGTMGVFDRQYLNGIGGLENVSGGRIALYTEYLHLLKTGLLDRVGYVNAPLVVYRVHDGSWSWTSTQIDEYERAGETLMRRGMEILSRPELVKDFDQNLTQFFIRFLAEFVNISRRLHGFGLFGLLRYFLDAKKYLVSLKGTQLYWRAARSLVKAEAWLFWALCKERFLAIAPRPLVSFAYSVRAVLFAVPRPTSLNGAGYPAAPEGVALHQKIAK